MFTLRHQVSMYRCILDEEAMQVIAAALIANQSLIETKQFYL